MDILNNPFQMSALIETQATYYPSMISIYVPKQPIIQSAGKIETGKHKLVNEIKLEDDAEQTPVESNEDRSIRRARAKIRDYTLCNSFDMFATFTFKSDRNDVERSKQKMTGWLKNQRNQNGKFRYLAVPEFHKDNQAIHFHVLMGDYQGKIQPAINPNTGKQIKQAGRSVFQIPSYRLGFNNVKLVGDKNEDTARISSYIQKYITKDMRTFSGRQKYYASKGMNRPIVENNPEKWYLYVEPDWSKEFENGTILRFNIGRNELVDIFWSAI